MSTEQKSINTIKKLALEMVCRAQSGHCGSAIDCASILYAIYHEASFSTVAPNYLNRDRVVLSNGHACASLYATLHLLGFDLSIDDLKDFRVLGSFTPGHPELVTSGVDCATGLLGQGIACAVGFALAESMLSAKYNRPGFKIVDHYTYLVCGDGDLMEGISYESFALAGKWKLNKLITIYNKNDITIDGDLQSVSCEDVKQRFLAQGFNVLECDNCAQNLIFAIKQAKQSLKPTIILSHTKIAQGTMYENSTLAHGQCFNSADIARLSKKWGLETEPFKVDLEVYKHFRTLENAGNKKFEKWSELLKKYKSKYHKTFNDLFEEKLNKIEKSLNIKFGQQPQSTVEANHELLQAYASADPNFVGGCADLSKSTLCKIDNKGTYSAKQPDAKNIAFGVRESAMSGILNGLTLHGGLTGFASTFLAFSDYMRAGIKMSAIMNVPLLYILTHDSISVGQDGTTHQPVEQLESLRLMPSIMLFRPADANETKFAYMWFAKNRVPSVLCLSKVKVEPIKSTSFKEFEHGAYILAKERSSSLNAILVATGSEVEIALRAKKLLEHKGYSVRVVSMPCRELFERQDERYKSKILPKDFPTKIVVEAGVTRSWESVSGRFGVCLGVNTFGESGTSAELYDLFGLTAVNIAKTAIELINKNKTY